MPMAISTFKYKYQTCLKIFNFIRTININIKNITNLILVDAYYIIENS